MPSGKFVSLDSHTTLREARNAAQMLKAAGIPSYIRGEGAALTAANPALAAVRLEVAEEDHEHAQLVLAGAPPAGAIKPADPGGLAETFPVHPDSDSLATLEVFYDSLEAKTAADLLRAHGIPCHLHGMAEGILPGLGGVPRLHLDVFERDLEQAYEILGFTVDEGYGDETDAPGSATPGSGHFQEAVPHSSRQIEHHPFRQREADDARAESMTPAAADSLDPQPAQPSIEAGAGGVDFGLVLLLLLIAGLAVTAAIWLVI